MTSGQRESTGPPALPDNEISKTAMQQALDLVVRDSLRPVALGLGLLYSFLTISHAIVLPTNIATTMVTIALTSAIALFILYGLLRKWQPPTQLAHPLAVFITGLILANSLIHLFLQPQPYQTTNLLLLIIAIGMFFLSTSWLIFMLAATLLGWLIIIWQAPPDPQWQHFGFAMLSTIALSVLSFQVRKGNFQRIERLRRQDEQRSVALNEALKETEQSRIQTENSKHQLEVALQAVQQNEAYARAIIDNMPSGLIIVDDRGLIEQVNTAAQQIFQYRSEELIGQRLNLLMPDEQQAEAKTILKNAYPVAIGRITEWEGRRKNGEIFPFELTLYQVKTTAGIRIAGNIRDLSERREVEKLKKEFISTVSHELRTPLTSIRGSLNLLAGGVLGDLSEEAAEVVTIAERNAIRLITLINDILDLERLETGRLEMNFADTRLNNVIERALESVQGFAEQEGIRLETATTNAHCFVDGDRIVQVLVNLLSNAIKFSPRGSTVTVSIVEQGSWVKVAVSDQGRGIPQKFIKVIFDRFKQVEAADNREKGGTGLGLAICKGIIEQHHGLIAVESVEGKGSIFWFRIPASANALKAKTNAEDTTGKAVVCDVLLVDDDEALLGVLTRQLTQTGLSVCTATSGKEALAQAIARPPGLLVLDVSLPEVNGFEVVAQLRRQPPLNALPLLIYTGQDLTGQQQKELSLGPTRFLTKSKATDEEFRAIIMELLQKYRIGETS